MGTTLPRCEHSSENEPPHVCDGYCDGGAGKEDLLVLGLLFLGLAVIGILFVLSMPGGAS